MAQEPLPPPEHSGGPPPLRQPQARTNEPALVGPEQAPVYANLIRSFTDLPPPPHGGNWALPPP